MVRVILHIGDGKCGSSSIQSALWRARESLRMQGLLYCSEQIRSGHFALVTLLGRETRGDSSKATASSETAVQQMREALAGGGISHLILSAESFMSLPADQVLSIVGMITGDVSGIDVVAYVREPSGMYLSWTQQTLKGDHLFRRPEHYDHRLDNFLIPWKTTPGVDSVTVRPFERALLAGGSVVSDFAEVLFRLTGHRAVLQETHENTSLTAEQMVVLQSFRARFCADAKGKQTRETNFLIQMFVGLNSGTGLGTPPRLQERWVTLIRVNAAPVFARLDESFPGIGKILPKNETPENETPEASGTDAPSNARNVRSVIEPVDMDIVALLKCLIPAFQHELAQGLSPRAFKAVQIAVLRHGLQIGQVVPVLCQYWRRTECTTAATELENMQQVRGRLHRRRDRPMRVAG